jgi:hypothetical protein
MKYKYVTLMTCVCNHHNNLLHKNNNGEQQQWQPNDGNNHGNNDIGVGKCGDGNSNYFAINLNTMAMTVAMTAPAIEAAALQ